MSTHAAHATQAVAVTITCPACRDGAATQQAIYKYRLPYLCAECREWWIEADNRAHRGVRVPSECPHHPNACVLERAECVGEHDRRMGKLGGARS